MALDSGLLAAAKAAGTRSEEAERQALLARAEYHTAIRRLHLAGGSLRHIARALALSHQRVQQIVSGAGGSWWRRIWRTRTIRPDAVCTWCGRPPSEVAKLIAGPAVYVCDRCVGAAERAVASGQPSGPFGVVKRKSIALRGCAFCGRAHRDRSLASAPQGHICTDCLRVCREILDGRRA